MFFMHSNKLKLKRHKLELLIIQLSKLSFSLIPPILDEFQILERKAF